jgi:hypothetical protein
MDQSDPPDAAAFVEYCRTQAALCSGRVQQLGEEADELLDEVDDELAALRGDLDDATDGIATPPSTAEPERPEAGGDEAEAAADAAESAVSTVEHKQTLVEAKQARMNAFNDLAGGYADLAAELDDVEDGDEALERVVAFEVERDAPAYFPDRETLAETVAEGEEDEADADE